MIIEDIKNLIEQLNIATKAYDEGHPVLSDAEWDDMYFNLKEMEEKTGIIYPNSPTQSIQYDVVNKLNKVVHNHKMLSLQKTKDLKEVETFFGEKDYVAMCKMDGLTCSLTYEDGKLISAETRGNGEVGEDILHNARVIPSIPQTIPYKDRLVVDGEIICSYDDFEEFQDTYKNPRNFAAGSIRLLSAKKCSLRKLKFVAWDVIEGNIGEDVNSFSSQLIALMDLGFLTVPMVVEIHNEKEPYFNTIETTLIETALKEAAQKFKYPIDGIVFKFNDINYSKSLGETSHHFKNAIAYKFYDEVYSTTLLDIEWSPGRTGVLTPIAIFEPIEIDGCNVSRASLHNINIMKELLGSPYVGQNIEVIKANEIIPQVVSAQKEPEGEVKYITIPSVCPICGGTTDIKCDINSEVLICTNPDCDAKFINRLEHFCSKKGLDIKGLSKATLEKLVDWGWISELKDIYTLKDHEKEWAIKPGFGKKSVSNILLSIENSRTPTLESFISAIGIPLIGKNMAKELVKKIDSYEIFREMIDEGFDFSKYDGFAFSKTESILNFDYREADAVFQFLEICKNSNKSISNSLSGITVVITGKLTKFKNRTELQEKIESCGGKVVGSVSKNTNYLINNDINSTSSKNAQAKKLNIPIISEEKFCKEFFD